MGSFATAFLMFGIALIYGFTGTFNLDQIAAAVGMSNGVIAPLFYTGILFILVGMLFKISAAPFHFWAPDVYEGAPSLITLFMSTVVKTASFAAFIRLFITCFASLATYLTPTLWIIALLTISIGNLSALKQHSFKRMLAYSSISHAGYMLLAILAIGPNSSKAVFLYASAYSIASITAFAIFIKVKEIVKSDSFEAFNGLGKRNPGMALALTIAMCSLAGIPLTAGFFGKFYIFTNAMAQNYYVLVLLAIFNAVIGIWYYFKVIIAMYMKQSLDNSPIEARGNMALVLFITTMATIILGIFPSILSSLF
jgi:NADH-quinone oxidoreductase subunit N